MLAYLPGQSTIANAAFLEAPGGRRPAARPAVACAGRWLPDHKWILASIDAGNGFLWMLNTDRDTLSRVMFRNDVESVAWNRATEQALYAGVGQIVSVTPDGSGREDVVYRHRVRIDHLDVSPDGRWMIFDAKA